MVENEEIVKAVFRVLIDEPFVIIKHLFRLMRIIMLIIISVFLYEWRVTDDYIILTNGVDIWNFFVSGNFFIPLGYFLLSVLLFDVILLWVIDIIWGYFLTNKFKEAAKGIKDIMNSKDEKKTALFKRFMRITINKYWDNISAKLPFDRHEITLQTLSEEYRKIKPKRLDTFCVTISQINVVLVFTNQFNWWILLLTVILITFAQILKSALLILKTDILRRINEPNRYQQ